MNCVRLAAVLILSALPARAATAEAPLFGKVPPGWGAAIQAVIQTPGFAPRFSAILPDPSQLRGLPGGQDPSWMPAVAELAVRYSPESLARSPER
jgi:hypothetical protein